MRQMACPLAPKLLCPHLYLSNSRTLFLCYNLCYNTQLSRCVLMHRARAIAAVIDPYPKDFQLIDYPVWMGWIDWKDFRRARPIMGSRKVYFLFGLRTGYCRCGRRRCVGRSRRVCLLGKGGHSKTDCQSCKGK